MPKIRQEASQPQYAIGEMVEAVIEGGTEVKGTVVQIGYNDKKDRWRYNISIPRSSGPPLVRWFPDYMVNKLQEELKFAATPQKKSRWKEGDSALLNLAGQPTGIPVKVERIQYSLHQNQEPRVQVRRHDTGQSWMVWESDIKPLQMDLFANWLERSRDMYRVEQKPIGRDRKQVEGPFPRSIPNTWMELPMEKPLSKKTAAGKCQMCGTAMSGTTCPRCKYTPTRKQFYGTRITAGDVVPFPGKAAPAPVMEPAAPGEDGADIADALLYQFDMLKGDLQNLMTSAQSWAAEATNPQEIVRLKRMAAKLQAMLKIIQQ